MHFAWLCVGTRPKQSVRVSNICSKCVYYAFLLSLLIYYYLYLMLYNVDDLKTGSPVVQRSLLELAVGG